MFLMVLAMIFGPPLKSQDWLNVAGSLNSTTTVDVSSDGQGNIFSTGTFSATARFSATDSLESRGSTDIFITQYTEGGDLVWLQALSNDSSAAASAIDLDPNGNIVVTGTFAGDLIIENEDTLTSMGGRDVFVVSFASNGSLNWAFSGGGSMDDRSLSMDTDLHGNIFVAGSFENQAIFDSDTLVSNGMQDMFALRLDASGNLTWSFSAGGPQNDIANAIASNLNGSIMLAASYEGSIDFDGNTLSSVSGSQLIARFDGNSGLTDWVQDLDFSYTFDRNGLAVDTMGNVYVAGSFTGTVIFGTTTLISAGSEDMILVKYDSTGTALWAERFGGVDAEVGKAVSLASNDRIYLAGTYEGNINVGTQVFSSAGMQDAIVIQMDGSGVATGTFTAGGPLQETVSAVHGFANGEFSLSGTFRGSVNFGSQTANSAGNQDGYTYKSDNITSIDPFLGQDEVLEVFPNPVTQGKLTLTLPAATREPLHAEIYNLQGQVLNSTTFTGLDTQMAVRDLDAGIYFLRVFDEDQTWKATRKILIQ